MSQTPDIITSLQHRAAVEASWANTGDRAARTAPARRAQLDRFAKQVDPEGVLLPAEREKRAEHARRAFMLELSAKSARARRRAKPTPTVPPRRSATETQATAPPRGGPEVSEPRGGSLTAEWGQRRDPLDLSVVPSGPGGRRGGVFPPRRPIVHDGFEALLESWRVDMRARNLSPKTELVYLRTARELAHVCRAAGLASWDEVDRGVIRQHVANVIERSSASNGSVHFRALQQLFRWLAEEEEIDTNPMEKMKGPRANAHPVPVLADDDVHRLLGTVDGRGWIERRDNAVLRVLLDTGIRLAELAGLELDDVDLVQREAVVTGKGRKTRTVKFGFKTAKALDRYLRVRVTHPIADTTAALWLAPKRIQPMTSSGLAQIIRRRGREVGLHLHPHRFRHNFAHQFLDQGGAEGDLMELAGWTSGQMLQRYGASARSARARKAYDRLQIGERF